jgi:hypothetical protein
MHPHEKPLFRTGPFWLVLIHAYRISFNLIADVAAGKTP